MTVGFNLVSQSATPTVEVLIVSYNTADLLRDCLRSLGLHHPAPGRAAVGVAVLDNASADGSADMVAAEFPEVRLVRSPANLGFGAGTNALVATSAADYVLLLNSDTVLVSDVVSPLLDVLSTRPDVAVVGPRLVFPDGTVQPSRQRWPSLAYDLARCVHGTKLDRLLTPAWDTSGCIDRVARPPATRAGETEDAEFLWATCWLVGREEALRLGPFSAAFPMYDEDLDCCRRLSRAGRRIVYLSTVELVHLGGGSSSSGAKATMERHARARYYRMHHGRPTEMAYRAVTAAVDAIKRINSRVRGAL